MRQVIRITESDMKRIVAEAIKEIGDISSGGTASEADSHIMAYREAIETAYNSARKADELVDGIGNPHNQGTLHFNIRKALEYLKFATQYYGETMG